ncbi:MAG TPA: cadmium resistance transporter [Micromonosporaceae bacterium]
MVHPLETVAVAVGVFAGTNVDDLIMLAILFGWFKTSRVSRRWQVWAGQYAGIGALVAASTAAALGLAAVPDRWVGLLGLFPFGLGVRALFRTIRTRGQHAEARLVVASGVFSVAGITIANGADNIAVYTPMLRTIGLTDSLITIAVFGVLTGLWCAAGDWLGSHPAITGSIDRYGHWIVPAVFMAFGAMIVMGSGVVDLLADLARP